jgi:hypothetical protein
MLCVVVILSQMSVSIIELLSQKEKTIIEGLFSLSFFYKFVNIGGMYMNWNLLFYLCFFL